MTVVNRFQSRQDALNFLKTLSGEMILSFQVLIKGSHILNEKDFSVESAIDMISGYHKSCRDVVITFN